MLNRFLDGNGLSSLNVGLATMIMFPKEINGVKERKAVLVSDEVNRVARCDATRIITYWITPVGKYVVPFVNGERIVFGAGTQWRCHRLSRPTKFNSANVATYSNNTERFAEIDLFTEALIHCNLPFF